MKAKIERQVKVIGGTLHQKDSDVWVDWQSTPCGYVGKETWTLPNTEWGRKEGTENFDAMTELFNEKQ